MLKKLVAGGALIFAWAVGCSSKSTDDFTCRTGHADCTCRPDNTCSDGLVCNQRHQCVDTHVAGRGGTAGDSAAGANGNGDAGQTMSGAGGTTSSNTGGSTSSSGGKSTTGKGGKSATGSGGSSNGAMSGTDGGAAGDGGALDQGGASGRDDGLGGMLGKGGSVAGGGDSGMGGSSSGMGGSSSGMGGTSGLGGSGGMAGTVSTGGMGGSGGVGAGAGLGGVSGQGGAGGKSGSGGKGGSGGKCTELTVGSVMYFRDVTQAPDITVYVYRTNQFGTASADYLEVQFYSSSYDSSDNGEDTGTFTLGTGIDANFKTCARCLLVDQDFVAGDATATYFATSGSMVVAAGSDQMNGDPRVTLNDVTLSEVTIDDTTSESTLVEGGKCVHFSTAKVQVPTGWTCPLDWYATDDGCDCGCGVRDGDCDNGNVSACDACHCGSTTSCSAVTTANNALCK